MRKACVFQENQIISEGTIINLILISRSNHLSHWNTVLVTVGNIFNKKTHHHHTSNPPLNTAYFCQAQLEHTNPVSYLRFMPKKIQRVPKIIGFVKSIKFGLILSLSIQTFDCMFLPCTR